MPLTARRINQHDSSASRLPRVFALTARTICLGRNERAGGLPTSDAWHKQRHQSLYTRSVAFADVKGWQTSDTRPQKRQGFCLPSRLSAVDSQG